MAHRPSEPVSVSCDTTASSDEVWALISDVARMGEWSPETVSCVWKGDASGPVEGARFTGRNARGWRKWVTGNTIIAAIPGRQFAFETTAGSMQVARWDYTLEPTESGCRITETWTDQRGRLATWAGRPLSGVADRARHNRAGMEVTLERLTAAAEA